MAFLMLVKHEQCPRFITSNKMGGMERRKDKERRGRRKGTEGGREAGREGGSCFIYLFLNLFNEKI